MNCASRFSLIEPVQVVCMSVVWVLKGVRSGVEPAASGRSRFSWIRRSWQRSWSPWWQRWRPWWRCSGNRVASDWTPRSGPCELQHKHTQAHTQTLRFKCFQHTHLFFLFQLQRRDHKRPPEFFCIYDYIMVYFISEQENPHWGLLVSNGQNKRNFKRYL